jgi:hypothetical protein
MNANEYIDDEHVVGDEVEVRITARVVEAYSDGSLLVDADGAEFMVYEGEFR